MSDVELTISAGRKEPSSFRLVATLMVAAACSGLLLSGVYQVTKPMIDANKAAVLFGSGNHNHNEGEAWMTRVASNGSHRSTG